MSYDIAEVSRSRGSTCRNHVSQSPIAREARGSPIHGVTVVMVRHGHWIIGEVLTKAIQPTHDFGACRGPRCNVVQSGLEPAGLEFLHPASVFRIVASLARRIACVWH